MEFIPINTQEEFDSRVQEVYGDVKDLQGQISTLTGERDTHAGTIAELQKQVKQYQTNELKQRIAQQKGIPAEMASRLTGETEQEIAADAYQGFAKQNYTMLDNLKLGYGGTKTEMQRLLKYAQDLTGVKYDINNLADVYNAVHEVQEELGVTGTTALEAWNAVISVDWLGLGGAIISGIIEGIWNAASQLLETMKQLAAQALQAAKEALGIASPSKRFRDLVGRWIPAGIAVGIRENFGLVTRAMGDLADLTTGEFTAALRVTTPKTGSRYGANSLGSHVVHFVQHVYAKAQTAAELAAETRYQAEMKVLLGV